MNNQYFRVIQDSNVLCHKTKSYLYNSAKILLIIFLLIIPKLSSSQQWAARYSNYMHNDLLGEDKAFKIAVDNSGGVYVTGFITTDSSGTNICTIKYDKTTGDTLWTRFFNGSGNTEDKAYAIIVDDEDNVYITGYTTSINTGKDITTIKYNSAGDTQWVRYYNGSESDEDEGLAMCKDANGNIIVTGYSTEQSRGKDIVIIKYTPEGNNAWTYVYNNNAYNNDDIANAIGVDSHNNIVVTGFSVTNQNLNSSYIVTLKVGSGGNVLWVKNTGDPQLENKAYAIIVDDLDNSFVTGYTTGSSSMKDITTVKYNTYGSKYWANTIDISGYDDGAHSIAIAPDKDIIITGTTQSDTTDGNENYIVIKYNRFTGSVVWLKECDGEAENTDIAYSLVVSPEDNTVYVTGSSKSSSEPGTEDMMTIKLDATTGDILDTAIYNGESNGEDVAYDIAIDTSGSVYVTGYTASLGGSDNVSSTTDYLTMKYSKGEWFQKSVIPGLFTLRQNYPNPFNPYTTIKFSMPYSGMAKLTVYDIMGREVTTLVNKQLTKGEYTAIFDGTSYASGVYFYVLNVNKGRDVKKMILIK